MNNPCRYCVTPKRQPGCKSSCSDYEDWFLQETERKERIRSNRENDRIYIKKYKRYKPKMR